MRIGTVATGAVGIVAIAAGFVALPGLDALAGEALFPYDDPVAVAAGKDLYADNCASCHGAELEGQPDWQIPDQDGLMPAPPHDKSGHTWHHSDSLLFKITKIGTEAYVGGTYKSNMAGFDGTLSDEQILATLAYIKSTWSARLIDSHNRVTANSFDRN